MERNERYQSILDSFNNKNNFVVKIDYDVLHELIIANDARKEEIFVDLVKNMPFFQIIKSNATHVLSKFLSIHIEQVIDVSNCIIVEKIKFDTIDNISITNSAKLESTHAYNFDINDFEIVLFIAKLKDETINNFKEIVSQLL